MGSVQEPPLSIDSREQLIFVLCEAAELEHSLTCAYLFAAWSLRTDGEGLTDEQTEAVRRWERAITLIAVQEMGHLALASNLLTALGAAPHLARPNLPQTTRYYPREIHLSFEPFNAATMRHFVYLERPEGFDAPLEPDSGPAADAAEGSARYLRLLPRSIEYATVGRLYRGIAEGFETLVEQVGEEAVFLGSPRAQATQVDFGLPELRPVLNLADALEVIETIVEEGEGARGNWDNAHYGRFLAVQRELAEMTAADPTFSPARPVLSNPFVRQPFDCDTVNLLTEPFTMQVSELANAAYASMLQVLARSFAHSNETDEELNTLATVSVDAMFRLLKPLGVLLTRLPAGPEHPGRTAGMSFELYRSLHLLPHRRAAWPLLRERFRHIGERAAGLVKVAPEGSSAAVLESVAEGFNELGEKLDRHILEQKPYTSGPR